MEREKSFPFVYVFHTQSQQPINQETMMQNSLETENIAVTWMSPSQITNPPTQTRDFISSIDSSSTLTRSSSNITEITKNASANRIEVSTALCLFDESWDFPKKRKTTENSYVSCAPRKILTREERNIKMMRIYTKADREEEREKGVSTQLKLFTDPWTIKKNLTKSDVGHMSRLLLSANLIKEHVLKFFPEEIVDVIKNGDGLHVFMKDLDTGSRHELVLKRWSTSKSFVLIGNWRSEFVNRIGLREGDEIGIFWNRFTLEFNFRLLRRAVAAENQNRH